MKFQFFLNQRISCLYIAVSTRFHVIRSGNLKIVYKWIFFSYFELWKNCICGVELCHFDHLNLWEALNSTQICANPSCSLVNHVKLLLGEAICIWSCNSRFGMWKCKMTRVFPWYLSWNNLVCLRSYDIALWKRLTNQFLSCGEIVHPW